MISKRKQAALLKRVRKALYMENYKEVERLIAEIEQYGMDIPEIPWAEIKHELALALNDGVYRESWAVVCDMTL